MFNKLWVNVVFFKCVDPFRGHRDYAEDDIKTSTLTVCVSDAKGFESFG